MPTRHARRRYLVVALLLSSLPSARSASAQITGGAQPMGGQGDYAVLVTPDGQVASPVLRGRSGNQLVFTVRNNGYYPDSYTLSCREATGYATCTSVVPMEVSLDPYQQADITITFTAPTSASQASVMVGLTAVGTGVSDNGSFSVPLLRPEGPLVTNVLPSPDGEAVTGDSLLAELSPPAGASLTSSQFWLNGATHPPTRVGNKLVRRNVQLAKGTYTWKSKVCFSPGGCDSSTTSFKVVGGPSWFALDSALPAAEGSGVSNLLGALPLPPVELRGCPIGPDDPEIRVSGPPSYLWQYGSTAKPSGLVFAAGTSTASDYVVISTLMVDHKPSDGVTCGNFTYLSNGDFDWSFWQGTSRYDTLWTGYPYSDKHLLGAVARDEDGFEYAYLDDVQGTSRGRGGPFAGAPRAILRRSGTTGRERITSRLFAPLLAAARRLPDPGAIKESTFRLTLNGTLIASGNTMHQGAQLVLFERYGVTVRIPSTSALLNKFNTAAPLANNGGWNELIATISDSTGHTTSVRARFPHLEEGPVAPLQLATLRDFSHLEQSECAAFGVMQCGGATLAYPVTGLVTRDRERPLHLVYRSASQRIATILPVQLSVARAQRAPDSLHVRVFVNGVSQGPLLRYSGRAGTPSGTGHNALQEHASETRVVGAALDAPSTGDVVVRNVTVEVTPFYLGASTPAQSISQDVVQVFLTDTAATRFGMGWQLAELHRLSFGHTFGAAPAAVWLRGDGSWSVFRLVGGTWQPPAGETARLLDSTVTPGLGARWVLALENGASLGFGWNGWQRHTEDLIGNRTTFEYDGSGTRLVGVKDPNLKGYRLTYDAGSGSVNGIRVESSCCASGGTWLPVASFAYSGPAATPRLSQATTIRGTSSDVTGFSYASWDASNALLDYVTDPRSTVARPVFTAILYEQLTRIPEGVARALGDTTRWRDPWRRAVPRAGFGRGAGTPLERLPFPNQIVGTWQRLGLRVMHTRVDAFGAPVHVREVSTDPSSGGMLIESATADYERVVERDAAGRVTKIVDARMFAEMADSVRYEHDALGRVLRIITPTKATGSAALDTVRFTHDVIELGSGRWCSRMTSSTDVLGATTQYRYFASGPSQCVPERIIGPANDTTEFMYGAFSPGVSSATRPIQIRDPNGLTQIVRYDDATWNTRELVRVGDGATSRAFYDPYGRPDSLLDPAGTPTRFRRDNTGRIDRQKTGRGPSAPMTATTYDAGGLVARVDVGASDDVDWTTHVPSPGVQSTRYFHDQRDQVDSILYPGSRTATGSAHRARKLSYLRMADGRPRFEFPGNGAYIGRLYDSRGNPKLVDHSRNDGGISVDGERYADAAALTFYNNPQASLGSGPQRHQGQFYRYGYDNKGRETWATGYDNYSRKEFVRRFRGWTRWGALAGDTLEIDGAVRMVRRYEYNRRGQRRAAIDSVLPLGSARVEGEQAGRVEYTYDSLTGNVTSIEAKANGVTYAHVTFTYDRGGRETRRTLSTNGSGTLVTDRFYDPVGRLDSVDSRVAGASRYSFKRTGSTLTDDLLSARLTGPWVAGGTLGYGYSGDGLRRLVSHSRSAPSLSQTWTHDVFGNAIQEYTWSTGGSCQGTENVTFDADNRLVRRSPASCPLSAKRFYHDQAGRRLGQADTVQAGPVYQSAMTYTTAGQLYYSVSPWLQDLIHFDHVWHWYAPDGYRVKSSVRMGESTFIGLPPDGGTQTLYMYDGADVAFTVTKTGTQPYQVRQRFLTVGVDQQVAVRALINGALYRNLALASDHQGSTIKVLAEDMSTVECHADLNLRGPYGTSIAPTQPGCGDAGSTGFTGASTPTPNGGFTYLRNRWYDPQTGRFLTQDPIGLAGGVNLYSYAGGNPVSYSDPFGLCPDCIVDGISVVLGVVDIARNGVSAGRAAAIAADAAGLLVPGVLSPGGVRRLAEWGAKHGGDVHWARITKVAESMKRKGWEDIRVNRRQVDAQGNVVGRNRPDVSGSNPKTGERVNIEFDNDARASARHRQTVTANDPDSRNVFIILE